MTDEEKDIYSICLDKKSLYCLRRMGEETCNKCKTYQMYRLGIAEGRKEKCLEQKKDGTIQPCEVMKDNEELKAQISVLLSCKSCPENKRGYICEKEYNDKCLGQKIQEVKELKEEIENLQKYIETLSENYENEIIEYKEVIEKMKCCENCKNHYWNYGELDCRLKYSCYDTNYDKWELAE